ncbi:histidinol-phosphatase HisJ [Halalkalibacter akibai]
MKIYDGHVHTPYCPHGTKDTFFKYCQQAIDNNITGITFTEHAPLPRSFTDPTPLQDSGMDWKYLTSYFEEVIHVKKEFKGHLDVNLGLEVDFIEGFEKETTEFLNEYGALLDDSILSVHFLKIDANYLCLDYSPDVFKQAGDLLGSFEAVYRKYFETVLSSIQANLGKYKPKRIGHITLARKFHKKHPVSADYTTEISNILMEIRNKGYELDYNGAGCVKPLCKEPYPYNEVINEAIKLGIPLVYGSDAHQASALLSGFESLTHRELLKKPLLLRD